jgi:DNA adenine methylase
MTQIYLLPELQTEETTKLVNVASVPQRSPFRYPGGKTWLVPTVRRWLSSLHERAELLVEPFAGGGIISLTVAFEKLAQHVLMVELDEQVAAVWETILDGNAEWLAAQILNFDLTVESAKAEVAKKPKKVRDLAFQTLLKNRTAHGGILAEGAGVLKHGENGKGILSRWYPQTIARRIRVIPSVSNYLQFEKGDAFEVLARHCHNPHAVFFIDPPYTAGGKRAGSRLYNHCEIDHDRLFSVCEQIKGDFLMTYDNAAEVRALAIRHGFEVRTVPMKNTHHAEMTELLIGRNLSWLETPEVLRESSTAYVVPAKQSEKRNRKAKFQAAG